MSVLKKFKIKIITQWCATSASITHVSGFKRNNYTVACHAGSGWGQGCFVENLYITGVFCGESSFYGVGI